MKYPEARHKAAERWLSHALQQRLAGCVGFTSTQADIIKLVLDELNEMPLWLKELLPPEELERSLKLHLNIAVPKPVHEVTVTLVVDPERIK